MSVQHANRGIVKKDLQLYYNREFSKSFRGESTTNIVSNTTDFSGVSYAGYDTEWSSDPTRFTKTYNSNLQTPIGTGATLLTESGTAGYYHLSRFGGNGEGGNSISCYVYSVNGSITNFTIGMLGDSGSTAVFNLVTGTVVSTGVTVSNAFIIKVSGWLGWYRVGANIGGRSGGWVGAVGLDVQTSYTPSLPYKSMYVTGMQYESKTYCTPFVVGSNRSANTVAGGGGLLDISGNNVNADLTNVSFDSTGYIFGGTNNYIQSANVFNLGGSDYTIDGWFYLDSSTSSDDTYRTIFYIQDSVTSSNWIELTKWRSGVYNNGLYYDYNKGAYTSYARVDTSSENAVAQWIHFACTRNGNTTQLFLNSVSKGTATITDTWSSNSYLLIGLNSYYAQYMKGQVAQLRIYRRSLTAAEVLQNFNATRTTYGI
jgi:hypothetical protein